MPVTSKNVAVVAALLKRTKSANNLLEEHQTKKAPGTKAPGTKAPGTKAPGTKAPGTKAPGTKAPGTKALAAKALAAKAPGTKRASGTRASGTRASGAKAPGTTKRAPGAGALDAMLAPSMQWQPRARGPCIAACDVPLCSVQEGKTPGSYWYVSEMRSVSGGICKTWKCFSAQNLAHANDAVSRSGDGGDEHERLSRALENLAWALVQQQRSVRGESVEAQMKYITPEEDRQHLLALIDANGGDLPSTMRNRAKFARLRDRRRATGAPLDGRARRYNSDETLSETAGKKGGDKNTVVRKGGAKTQKAAKKAAKKAPGGEAASTTAGSPGSAIGSQAEGHRLSSRMTLGEHSRETMNFVTSPLCREGEVFFPAADMEAHGLTSADLLCVGYASVRVCDNGTGVFVVPAA